MVRRFSWVERTQYRYTTLPGTVSNHLVSRSFVWPPADHGAAALDWPTSQELDGRCLCTDDNGDDERADGRMLGMHMVRDVLTMWRRSW